jgi:hypothetical protein
LLATTTGMAVATSLRSMATVLTRASLARVVFAGQANTPA